MRRIVLFAAAALLSASALVHAESTSADGQLLFEQKCTACHTIGGGARVGPDLQGVTTRRTREWLSSFIAAPDRLIAARDPIVMPLLKQFNQIPMPNLALAESEVRTLVDYLEAEDSTAAASAPPVPVAPMQQPSLIAPQSTFLTLFLAFTVVIAVVFVWIGLSTRLPASVDVKRAYGIRRVFFIVGTTAAVVLLVATVPLAPYARAGARADRGVYVAARQFDFVFSDEPITSAADLAQVPRIANLEVAAGTLVEFRVTSLDVTHGFALYGAERQIIAQTQAMPGYFNRLLVRFDEPAQYKVFCLEYCAAGHHLMQAQVAVNQQERIGP